MMTRRHFFGLSALSAAHLRFTGGVARALHLEPMQPAEQVAAPSFGRLAPIATGVWALVSSPLGGDRTTFSNGGLVAGRDGVLAIEGLNTPAGAQWLAAESGRLTGRLPTHVVLTHYHSDHANGVSGYLAAGPRPIVLVTSVTRELVLNRNQPVDAQRTAALESATILNSDRPTTIGLGSRAVRLVPRVGHTSSDMTVEVDDASVVFGGDLLWNGFFPNYVDALPSELTKAAGALSELRAATYVPGHGNLSKTADVERYSAVLGEVEAAAARAYRAGDPAAVAAKTFQVPQTLGEWTLLNPSFLQRAFEAWYRELN